MKRLKIILLFFLLMTAVKTGRALSEEPGAGKGHPCIHIVTEDGRPVLLKEKYIPAVISVFNCEKAYEMSAEGGVRVRGNSTAEQGEEKSLNMSMPGSFGSTNNGTMTETFSRRG